MTPGEHYAEAERLLAASHNNTGATQSACIAAAQAHAMLAAADRADRMADYLDRCLDEFTREVEQAFRNDHDGLKHARALDLIVAMGARVAAARCIR